MHIWIQNKSTDWLPTSRKEAAARGWDELDVILFTGDAYIDHPAFGAAVIGRILEQMGLSVAIIPQPNWRDDLRDFKKLGRPRLFFGVTAGAMDSMINHYTANKRIRSDDAYTPGDKSGFRPDYPTLVYTGILKKLYPDVPVILGGIEASLRRVTHYDYWSDHLKPSILLESGADLLVYGMGEMPLQEIARLMEKDIPLSNLTSIRQTAYLTDRKKPVLPVKNGKNLFLFSHEECLSDKKKYAKNFRCIEEESNKFFARRIIQGAGDHWVVVNPPYPPMEEAQMDASFDLPFTRLPHPRYKNKGILTAFEMIKFSVNSHRGCFGGCSFCTISAHQGKFISSRSERSIKKEVETITRMPGFKGHITDIGGPSANMYKMKGKLLELCQNCKRPSCIFPKVCSNLDTDHTPMTKLYKSIAKHTGVKKATIGSGIRYDLLFDSDGSIPEDKLNYAKQLISKHISGRLKVAPEHTSGQVLKIMRKPSFQLFYKFMDLFDEMNREEGLNQQLIPYFISSFPGSSTEDMAKLAAETRELEFQLEQVQDFTPTPMTLATVIYYSGYHPYTMEKVYTARSQKDKNNQRQFFFWYKKEFQDQIKTELKRIGRDDLIEKLYKHKNAVGQHKHIKKK
ncbi:MAG: YgiQ family radical SAM protein [Candidatus Aminicenantes bacterium]|nr:YgiQ family radical SAM protein [Candidatus Aminicenantes bacterium]